jgi:hypothetical protein
MAFQKAKDHDGRWMCCASVHRPHIWRAERCARVATVNESWCKQHNPVKIAERQIKSQAAYATKRNEELPRIYGHTLLRALKEIYAGHNDPRARAKEAIDYLEEMKRK